MESSTPHSKYLCHQQLCLSYFFRKCCFFLFMHFLFIVLLVGLAVAVIVFVLKPQTPIFSVQTVKVESYKLDVNSGSDLFVSSVVSLTLNASNPNKVGINYGSSRLYVLQEGLVVGIMRVRRFYQPPHSKNVTMQAEVVFESVSISKLTSGKFLHDDSRNGNFQMRILGDIRAQLQIFQVTLPNIKIAMDCDINIDHNHLTLANEMYSIVTSKDHMISIPFTSKTISKRCSFAIYM